MLLFRAVGPSYILVIRAGSPIYILVIRALDLKEAILEAKTFVLNLDRFESKLQWDLEISNFNQYASVIPVWKANG